MLRFPRTGTRAAALVVATLTALALPALAAPTLSRAPIKQLQVRRMRDEPMREMREKREHAAERRRELRRLAAELRHSGRSSLHVTGERARRPSTGEEPRDDVARITRAATPLVATAPTAAPRANVRCNDPSADGASDGQCETTIARWNDLMVAAWNDGTGFTNGSLQTQGWATSNDGGVTWTDRGSFPIPAAWPSWRWASDPVLAVNPTTGAFYFSALADANAGTSAIGVIKGRFTGGSFAWGEPSVPRTTISTVDFLDKEWIAIDPATGRTYLSYTEFLSSGRIDIIAQAADSALTSWSAPIQVSATRESGGVQGSRPIVCPDGTADIVYWLIGSTDVDFYRVVRSQDGGASWSAPTTAVSFVPNFTSGAPGFDRALGIEFPSIAVDRSAGPHAGRLYLAWAESMDWFPALDNLGHSGTVAESEPNDTPPTATPLLPGQAATGAVSASADLVDWYAVTLGQGQSIVVATTAIGANLAITMRVFATDGSTRLVFTTASPSDFSNNSGPPSLLFTAPTAGKYYVRVASLSGAGTYTLATAPTAQGSERGRDQRDVFVCSSDDDGITWSTPVRVDNDPVGYDDWLPEVAVGADGVVFAAWYDWRDATPTTDGGESSVYLARSSDGGATWAELGATSDQRTAWSNVVSNITPNEGDYLSLFTDASGLSVAWADGRAGNPDVYMSYWRATEASTLPALLSVATARGRVDLVWRVGTTAGFAAELYRRPVGAATWDSLGTLLSAADGTLAHTDLDLTPGASYQYRLGVVQDGVEYFYGATTVLVPTGVIDVAGAWPHPATRASVVWFTLASSAPATLDLLDLTGRRVWSRPVGQLGPGTHSVPFVTDATPAPGVYFLRLTQSGNHSSKRVVVL